MSERPDVSDRLRRDAVTWVQRLLSGQATAADGDALRDWLAGDAARAAAFAEARGAWTALGAARQVAGPDAIDALVAGVRRHQAIRRRTFLAGGLAATAVAAGVVRHPPLELWPSLGELMADHRTAVGEQRQLTLGEDISVRLNTRTSIVLRPPGGDTARIELITGEAAFTAAAAPRRLTVLALGGSTIGSGAQFDVRHLGGSAGRSVCVTCLDGVVDLDQRDAGVTLRAGQRVRYDESGFQSVEAVDLEVASAWQRGIVVFRATPLVDVVDEINRYRPGRIVLVNPELGRRLVSGRFRTDRLDEILTRLELAFGAHLQTLPGGLALLS